MRRGTFHYNFSTRCIVVFGVKHGVEPCSKRLLEDEGLRDRCLSQESKHLGHTGSSLTGMHKMVTLKPRGETMRINTESSKSRAFFRGFSRVFLSHSTRTIIAKQFSIKLSIFLGNGKRGIYDACSVFTEFSKAYLYASIQIDFRQFRVAFINQIPLENG